jgi:hypothetical protein
MVKVGFLLSHFLLSVFSQEDQPINLTHSTAPSAVFKDWVKVKKRGSGSTLSKPWPLGQVVEGLTLVEVTNRPFFTSLQPFPANPF